MEALRRWLPVVRERRRIDLLVINAENAARNGRGLGRRELEQLFELGADVITTGNHVWENREARELLQQQTRLLRPANYPEGNPGRGWVVVEGPRGIKAAVLQLQGRLSLFPIDCPFRTADRILEELRRQTALIVVDFHAESTGEKQALGWYLDGRVSAVLGTHTHVQTADAQILPSGTAYVTDVGMTGPSRSVLGMRIEIALRRYLLQTAHRYEPGEGEPFLSAVFLRIEPTTGRARAIEPLRLPELRRQEEQ